MVTFNKISRERADELTRIPTRISNTDAYKRLESAGWELVRTGHHHIYKKDGETITLPGTGDLSPWLTQLVYKASTPPPKNRPSTEKLPLMVRYREREYAVVEKKGGYYVLTDLLTGARATGLILECFRITEDEAPRLPFELPAPPVETAEKLPIAVDEGPKVTATPPLIEETKMEWMLVADEDDALAAWIATTEKFIESLGVRAEKLLHEAAALEDQQKALREVLVNLRGGKVVPEPRRTVLPPAEPNKRRDGFKVGKYHWAANHFSAEEKEKVKDYLANGIKGIDMAERLGKSKSTVYAYLSYLKETGT